MSYKESYDWFIESFSSPGIYGPPDPFDYKIYQMFEKGDPEIFEGIKKMIKYLVNHDDIEWVSTPAFVAFNNEPKVVATRLLEDGKYPSHRVNTKLYLYSIILSPGFYKPFTDENYIEVKDGLYAQTSPIVMDPSTFIPYRSLHIKWSPESKAHSKVVDIKEFKEKINDVIDNIDQYIPKPMYGIMIRYCLVDKD